MKMCEGDQVEGRKEAEPSAWKWRPITEIPAEILEGGKEVLLLVEKRAGVPGKCLVGHWMPGGHCIEDHPPIQKGWYFWNGRMFDMEANPTHWAPLPGTNAALTPQPDASHSGEVNNMVADARLVALVERLEGPVMQSARDLIASYFKRSDKCLASIPARPDHDADLVLTAGIRDAIAALRSRPAGEVPSRAALDVLAERQRQISAEGFTDQADNAYQARDLAMAGACYAMAAGATYMQRKVMAGVPPRGWPWAASWWKPTDPRRDLVKAGALILAEIERIDRTGAAQEGGEG